MEQINPNSGHLSPHSKCTYEDVVEIRRLYSEGAQVTDLATQFKISRFSINDIVKGKSYKNVPFTEPVNRGDGLISTLSLEGEEWRDIQGYEGIYKISTCGRILSIKHKDNKILSPRTNSGGYKSVQLCKEGIKRKAFEVQRLVAINFIPNPDNLPCVNHIDSNPLNNNIGNLEWVTVKENFEHAKKSGRINLTSRKCHTGAITKLTVEQVLEIKSNLHRPRSYFVNKFNVSSSVIRGVYSGKNYKSILPTPPNQ